MRSLLVLVLSVIGMSAASAHHSFALYDMAKSAEVDGTVVKMEWSNPHCWLFILSLAPDGTQTPYGFEMTSVGEMTRRGWAKNALKAGDRVKVKYHPVHDGKPAGYMMTVMTADGKYIGRPPDAAPPGP
jgi:Family of unknown function (DUF6152)